MLSNLFIKILWKICLIAMGLANLGCGTANDAEQSNPIPVVPNQEALELFNQAFRTILGFSHPYADDVRMLNGIFPTDEAIRKLFEVECVDLMLDESCIQAVFDGKRARFVYQDCLTFVEEIPIEGTLSIQFNQEQSSFEIGFDPLMVGELELSGGLLVLPGEGLTSVITRNDHLLPLTVRHSVNSIQFDKLDFVVEHEAEFGPSDDEFYSYVEVHYNQGLKGEGSGLLVTSSFDSEFEFRTLDWGTQCAPISGQITYMHGSLPVSWEFTPDTPETGMMLHKRGDEETKKIQALLPCS